MTAPSPASTHPDLRYADTSARQVLDLYLRQTGCGTPDSPESQLAGRLGTA